MSGFEDSPVHQDLPRGGESSEVLLSGEHILVERITSIGYASPPDFWYDQERDEWVLLLQGEGTLDFGTGGDVRLAEGEWLLIPAHTKHRVKETSIDPPCIWLCVHARLT